MTLILANALLAGCLGHSAGQPVATASLGSKRSITAQDGVVLVGFEKAKQMGESAWGITLARLDSFDAAATDQGPFQLHQVLGVDGCENFTWFHDVFRGRPTGYQALAVRPGRYAVLEFGAQSGGRPVYPVKVAGGASVTGTTVMIGTQFAMTTLPETEIRRPPLRFVSDGRLVPEAPVFDVRAGEVVNIGSFKLGMTVFTVERAVTQEADPGSDATERKAVQSLPAWFIEYEVDEVGARRAASELNLSDKPLRTVELDLGADQPIWLDPHFSEDVVITYASGGKVTARQTFRAP